jgi:hypothetical protein
MVVVSHAKEFIFLKTHKTGGTSFEMMLEPWCTPPGHVVTEAADELISEYGLVGARMNRKKIKPVWRNHVAAKQVAEFLGPERWDRYYKLTSVRNPFSRAVSKFYFGYVWRKLPVPQTLDDNRAQFREFIFSKTHNADAAMTHLKGKYIIDDAIRIEHIDADLARIGARLDLPLSRASLPHTKENSGTKPAISFYDLFDPDLEEEVRTRQAWVFEHCGYSTKLADARL